MTGSGKTEVYLHLIERVLAGGGQVLVLVPEINLTPQLESRLAARFPKAVLASLHSGIPEAERLRRWRAAESGQASILIGTRLAVFTPLPRLGLIVVDEEHDASLKQQEGLRYSARDLAVLRAKHRQVPVRSGIRYTVSRELRQGSGGPVSVDPTVRAGELPAAVDPLRGHARPAFARWVVPGADRCPRENARGRRAKPRVHQPPRLRSGVAVLRLRLERAVSALLGAPGVAPGRGTLALPLLRARGACDGRVPELREPGPHRGGARNAARRTRAGAAVSRGASVANRPGHHAQKAGVPADAATRAGR